MNVNDHTPNPRAERSYWLDRPGSATKIFYALIGLCTVSVLADLFYEKHVHYAAEKIIGAYGIYGFVCCVGLVLAAKELRKLLKREESYYADDE